MKTLTKPSQKYLVKLQKNKNFVIKWMHAFYKVCFQPQLGFACKFHPTCSCYAKQSFQQHSLFKALGLTVWRILRCQPFSRGGFDPVPRLKEKY